MIDMVSRNDLESYFLRANWKLIQTREKFEGTDLGLLILILKMLGILLAILILGSYGDNNCTNQYELACCKNDCTFCGKCGLSNQTLNGSLYDSFDENCCSEIILSSHRYCNETAPPCILESWLNNLQRIINFFKSGQLQSIIPVSIVIGLISLFIFYSCFIFGTKKPPKPYRSIVNCLRDIE